MTLWWYDYAVHLLYLLSFTSICWVSLSWHSQKQRFVTSTSVYRWVKKTRQNSRSYYSPNIDRFLPRDPKIRVGYGAKINDLAWPWRAIRQSVLKHMRLLEPTTKIWIKIDPYYQQRGCSPTTLDSGNIRFMRILAGVRWRWYVKRQWGNRKRRFSGLSDATSSAP